jgi:predicted NBD/HSP70 family sugar kinase
VVSNSAEPPVARQLSMNAVIQTIRASGPISRAELAKVTGFSKQTISEVVHELAEEGWLRPCGRTTGRLGRSAVTYEINGRAALAAGIDLGGSKISAAVCDLAGEILAEALTATDPRGGVHLVDQLAGVVDKLLREADASTGDIRLIVLGTPGVFQSETGRISIAPNVPGLDTIDLRGLLAERLGVPVLVENDVNLAARGEQWRGRGAGLKNFAFVALGTGIGMGIVADGHLLRGARGAAGEISYLPLGGDPYDPSGFAMGTLERAVGSAAIARRFAGFGGREGATVREVFEALGAGEKAAIATIEETARLIAPAIAAIGAMLDPEIVILGGSVGIRNELVDAILRFLPRCTPDPPCIEASILGGRAALIGALGAAVSRMYHDLFGVDLPAADFSPPHWPVTRSDGPPAHPALS